VESFLPAPAGEYVRRRAGLIKGSRSSELSAAKKVSERAQGKRRCSTDQERGFSRLINAAVGTAVNGCSAVLGYNALGGSVSRQWRAPAGFPTPKRKPTASSAGRRQPGRCQGQSLGNWVALLPTKAAALCHRPQFQPRAGSIWYWNYGDYNPISHHLCSPAPTPARIRIHQLDPGRPEFADLRRNRSRQAETVPEGTTFIARDGTETADRERLGHDGLGLGVHVTINPKDAQSTS
jgi:hypothetical protein